MMKHLYLNIVVGLVFSSCGSKDSWISISNDQPVDRMEEPFVVSRSDLELKLGELGDELPLLLYDETVIPQQLDDINGDGIWDELAALIDIDANETKKLELTIATDSYPEFKTRTNIYLGVDYNRSDSFVEVSEELRHPDNIANVYPMMYQMEGPAWENDKVGFRNYFDSRNGKDIFGKTTSAMTLHSTGSKGQNYHKLDEWGMDILKVANSLGAGGAALCWGDSLIRLGNTPSARFKIITEGPIRSVFEITHNGWQTPIGNLNVTERITIWAGQYAFHEELIVYPTSPVNWIVGFVNKHVKDMVEEKWKGGHYIATYDNQSENSDQLGMAIIAPQDLTEESGKSPDSGTGVTETYYLKTKAENKKSISFSFIAGWGLSDPQFLNKKSFYEYVRDMALKTNNPLILE